MILYVTYNDQPTGVYWSQVTDVVRYLNTLGGQQVRLLALVSGRDYPAIRREIRAHCPGAMVLPMVPKMKHWRGNRFLLHAACLYLRPSTIIARGALATWMALRVRNRGTVKKVCFDGRGAYAAEWEEYRIIDDDALIAQLRPVEQEAVLKSDFRIAVSHALVDHWRSQYGYALTDHIVVPCTLMSTSMQLVAREEWRKKLGYGPEDVVLVYSGSAAGWQSFALLDSFLREAMQSGPEIKVLFLSRTNAFAAGLAATFPGRVATQWLPPTEVANALCTCDMALLLRETSITNSVASPTKFAEYLACGLPVIISAGIGDFSAMVEEQGLGVIWNPGRHPPPLLTPSSTLRHHCRAFASAHFTKEACKDKYLTLLERST